MFSLLIVISYPRHSLPPGYDFIYWVFVWSNLSSYLFRMEYGETNIFSYINLTPHCCVSSCYLHLSSEELFTGSEWVYWTHYQWSRCFILTHRSPSSVSLHSRRKWETSIACCLAQFDSLHYISFCVWLPYTGPAGPLSPIHCFSCFF